MDTFRKSRLSLYIAAWATLIVSSFWGLYFMAPGYAKAAFSLCMWVSVFTFPFVLIKRNDVAKQANWLLRALIVMGVLQTLRSAVSTDPGLDAIGNKWLTLFGNEYTALLLVPPLFAYLGTLSRGVGLLMRVTYIYLAVGFVLSVYMKFPLAMLMTFAVVFYPYVGKKYKALIVIAAAEAFIKATTGANPSRMYLIVLGFALCAYFLVYKIKNNSKVLKVFAVAVVIAPLVMFVPILGSSDHDETTFQKIQAYIMQESGDESMASDTRTFLYLEMAEDLTNTNSWIIGKGAFSRYYSLYFDESSIGKYGRISSEVPFLNYLLRGGLLYVVVYFSLLVYAVYLGIWKGRNKFVQSIAVIALGWYFNSFVGDITGCRFYHFAFFLLLGCCLSSKWRNCSDAEIKTLLPLRKKQRMTSQQY